MTHPHMWQPSGCYNHMATGWLRQVPLGGAALPRRRPERFALVAAHAWDCAGAGRAGLRTGWLPRTEPRWPDAFPPPDVTADDLPSLVAALLDQPGTG
jgi:hypothetical protein